jgi:predicted GNAT superfamily acetyltransferase
MSAHVGMRVRIHDGHDRSSGDFRNSTLPFSFRWSGATYGVPVADLTDRGTDLVIRDGGTLGAMFRVLASSDCESIWEINQSNVPAVGEETPQSLEEILHVAEIALGVVDEDVLVGFCLVLPPGTAYDSPNYRYFCDRFDDFSYLDRVAFRPSHQGRGLGAALYREVERRMVRPRLTLEVNVVPPNEGSMRFHLREGFVELDRCETRPGKVVSLMSKECV